MTDPERAKAAFPVLFKSIREQLIKYDPSGLFGIGAPKDEHDDSAYQIISRLRSIRDADEVVSCLDQVMGGWLEENPYANEEIWQEMAPPIWAAWLKFKASAERQV